MYLVGRSDTGQYVITDPASKTVMVGDDLPAMFERMAALQGERSVALEPAAIASSPAATSRVAGFVPWLALALLPFVWLGALHVSLGRLVAELRTAPGNAEDKATVDLRARLDRVERQIDERPAAAAPRGRGKAPPPSEGTDDTPDAKKADAKADTKPDDAKLDEAKRPPIEAKAADPAGDEDRDD